MRVVMIDNIEKNGVLKDGKFYLPIRVYYEDTDAGGVVYYANYLKFAERARTEFVRALGVEQNKGLVSSNPCAFVVRRCEADYQAPAVLDDQLIVVTELEELGAVSAVVRQNIYRDEKLLVSIKVKVAYISIEEKKPQRLPPTLNAWYKLTFAAKDKNSENAAK